jgi:UDP-glucose 4-epimerase
MPLWNAATSNKASKEIINLGGIEEYSINSANKILKEIIGSGSTVYKESRHEVKHSIPTYQKSIDILGFEHKTDLKTGLIEMWEWVQQQPKRERFVWDNYEINKGIYSFWKK